MERLFKLILLSSALFFTGYCADTHLGDGVYLLDGNIDPNNSVVKVSISSEQIQKLVRKDFIYDEDSVRVLTFQKELWDISRNKIYSKFNDDFDFIFYVLNSTSIGQLGFSGRMMPVRIDCANADIYVPKGGNTENYEKWGSDNKLKGVIYFPLYNAIKDGPSLHELAHQWGAKVSPDVLGHWGASNAGGQLGGFKYVKALGNNQYQGSITGDWDRGFGKDGYSKNVYPYSDIELYLMGFKSAQDLRNSNFKLDVYLNNGAAPKSVTSDGIFTADKINSYTIDDLMKNFGGKERDPNSSKSQKNFKVLTVFLSLTDTVGQTIFSDRTNKIVEDINWFTQKTEYSGGYYNFYQATNKVGSIDAGGLKNSVKAGIDKSNPDPNPAPAAIIIPEPKPANLTVLPVSLNLVEGYGDTSFTVSVSNSGGLVVVLKDINISGANFTKKSTGGTRIFPYSTQNSWTFAPVGGLAKGRYSGTISASFEDYADLSVQVELVVRGKTDPAPSPANLTISPIILNYPLNYGDSNVVIAINNDGEINAVLDKKGVSSTGGNGKFYIYPSSGSAVFLPNYENKTWFLMVKSGLDEGTYSGEITVKYDNGKSAAGEILLNVGGDLDTGNDSNTDDGSTPLKEPKPRNKKYGVFFDKNPVSEKVQINLKPHEALKLVKISIYDYLGNIVFVEESRETGKNEFVWNLNNLSGRKVANGTYFVVAECAGIDGKLYGYSAKVGVKR